MRAHESSVNYQNLIRDLAEMYPLDVADVVVVELVANALDAGAVRVELSYDPDSHKLTVFDDGKGMSASQFSEYHDFAAGLKDRGTGIGFAGVGAKISFNIADRVVTETHSQTFSGGSNWYLQSEKHLVWEETPPSKVSQHGTRVEVHFRPNVAPGYSTRGELIGLLKRHYLPLFDTDFLKLYGELGYYSADLTFVVNDAPVERMKVSESLTLEKVRRFMPKRRGTSTKIGYGVFGLASCDYPLGPDQCGVILCTHGKTVKSELFNQFPGSLGPRLFGLVEIPHLIKYLTTAKNDFLKTRGDHKDFESLYDPVRQEFKSWLAELGVQALEHTGDDETKQLERELKELLTDIPELKEFLGQWGNRRVLVTRNEGSEPGELADGTGPTFPIGPGSGAGGPGPVDAGEEPRQSFVPQPTGTSRANPITRKAKAGPRIAFRAAPEQVNLAWVESDCIFINSSHPSYSRATGDARRLHCLFAIGSAIQRFRVTPDAPPDLLFIDRLMAAWGSRK